MAVSGSTTVPARRTGEELLAGYRPGTSFFFATPTGTFRTDGVRRVGTDPAAATPAELATALLRQEAGEPDPTGLVVGAVPFAAGAAPHLVSPLRVNRAEPLRRSTGPVAGSATVPATVPLATVPRSVQAVPSPAEYGRAVRRALEQMKAGGLEKVVLARTLEIATSTPVDLTAVLRALAAGNPDGYVFSAPLPAGRTLFGASPELLLSRTGRTVVANPMAGSAPRGPDPVQDRANAAALLGSGKDRREHALVVDAVVEGLGPLCAGLTVPPAPTLVPTGRMWHLSTVVTGQVADPEVSALALASALHPTPAVCGTPVPAARAAIGELEPFDRGFYTGAVGWVDAAGDGQWVVTIRCGETRPDSLRLYAGAGIVPGSDPAAEIAETSAKFRTLLDALGLDHAF